MSLLRKLRLFLVMFFLQGITVNVPPPVSQLLAPERHEFDLIGRRVKRASNFRSFKAGTLPGCARPLPHAAHI
jgi:hypothetical protein